LLASSTAKAGVSASGGAGASLTAGGNHIQLTDAQARFGRVGIAVHAAQPTSNSQRDLIAIDHGRLVVGGDLSIATFGSLAIVSNAGTLDAGALVLRARGSIAVEGAWTAPSIDLTATDLALGEASSLTATGDLRLTSINSGPMLIGDGANGSGFALSDAEFGRLKGGNITLGGSRGTNIVLGRLTLSGAQLGASGTLRITSTSAGNRAGVISLVGQVNGTGLGNAQTVEFETSRVEIDGTSGGINLAGSGASPGGRLSLRTDRLWAAEPAVLGRLSANAAYVGREADLANPLAPARPAGIIRAGQVRFVDTRQILVQNSGSRSAPAGITTASGAFLTFAPVGQPNGPVELIVSGQVVGQNGTPTGGSAVQGAFTRASDFSSLQFTPNSSVNGCLVSAASCGPVVVTYLSVLPGLPDKLFGDGEGEGEGESSAINPAEKLVDRKSIERPQPVDEPVSGGGDPALMSGSLPTGGEL
jgi:hypothetical protein